MKFWQALIYVPTDELVDLASLAESVGFEGVIMPDHVVFPEAAESRYPYADIPYNPKAPFADCVAAIGAMAGATTRLRFATYVYVLPMRDPYSVAKAFGTLAILSGGRVSLGAGVGWLAEEFTALGADFATRGRRMDSMLGTLRDLFAEGRRDDPDVGPVHMRPIPADPVPIWIGGHSEVALARAARYDGWLGLRYGMDELTGHLERLAAALAAAGRDRSGFEVMAVADTDVSPALVRDLEALGVTSILTPPPAALGARTPTDRADLVRRFGESVIQPERS
jgi:probable F420-dependent oxidoreductase